MPSPPLVLCLSGLDPGGGAGLQADIETVAALGGHALGLATCLTVQDSRDVARVVPVEPGLLAEQLEVLLADMTPQAVKLGLLGDAAQLPLIVRVLRRCGVPVVCDPVLRAGGGALLHGDATLDALRRELLAHVTVLTPNAAEARRLCPGAADLDACGAALLAAGCARVLITGGDEPGTEVSNSAYAPGAAPRRYRWARLPETFHGAGCTLAAAVAVLLAGGADLDEALGQAQEWTQGALRRAFAVGRGRRIPGRIA
ncbi:MAG TPA: hydroxymethylpyrimidine/phosphomethylpyrimidine kinase [Nevskia sp.]|nr:hydroxymethylpyrimidine/phosphomethylpyrimidine kinase [Nevskia sp.]